MVNIFEITIHFSVGKFYEQKNTLVYEKLFTKRIVCIQGKSLKIADTRLERKTGSIDALTFVKVKTWTRNMIMSKKNLCQSGIIQFFLSIS